MAAPTIPSEFYLRLERFARSTGLSINAFGQQIGFPSGTFSRILRDQVSIGVNHVIHTLVLYPELNPRWLLLGDPPMILSERERLAKETLDEEILKLKGENEALREVLGVWADQYKEANPSSPA